MMKKKNLLLTVVAIFVLAAISMAQTVPSYVPTNGLVGWWPFNGNANDESGNGHDGTVDGTILCKDRNGIPNKAYNFDGLNDVIVVLDDPSLKLTGDEFTLSVWIKHSGFNNADKLILNKSNGPGPQIKWILMNSCGFNFPAGTGLFTNPGISGTNFIYYNNNPDTIVWYLSTIVKNVNNDLNIYLNGNLVKSVSVSANLPYTNANLRIGGDEIGGGGHWFWGKLDDIGLWNRALTEFEVLNLYYSDNPSFNVNVRVLLQSAWASGYNMYKQLNTLGMIPQSQPFNALPWSYSGQEYVATVPPDITDWVLVELRSTVDTVIARRAGLLRNDGFVMDTNGTNGLQFSTPPGEYYISVRHRNHLPVMSRHKISFPDTSTYNFTDTLNFPVYGDCVIDVENGISAMILGDVNNDNVIKYSGPSNDRSFILQQILKDVGGTSITSTTQGYYPEDINLNGILKYSGINNDPSYIIQTLIFLTGSTSITSLYYGCVPNPVIIPPPVPWSCGDAFIDSRDGKSYNSVQIGTQCWMQENLAYLPSVSPSNTGSDTIPFYYVYDYQGTDVFLAKATSNFQTYGVLYNWTAAMNGESSSNSVPSGVQGVCPTGWHLPSYEEWKILFGEVDSQYGIGDPEWDGTGWLGFDVGSNLKEAGTTHWMNPNNANNSSEFSALPSGYRSITGIFGSLGYNGYFWSATENTILSVWRICMRYDSSKVWRASYGMDYGRSVRCIRNCSSQPTQSNAGPDSLNIPGDSITLMANTPIDGQGLWSIASETGGSYTDSTSPTSVFYGTPGQQYNLVWTISNNCGSSSDTVVIGFASSTFPCGDQLIDSRDGNTYNTVLIGSQCWMSENLAYLPLVYPSDSTSYTTPYYYVYDYQGTDVIAAKATINYQTYGALYNWPAAMAGDSSSNNFPSGVPGICPTGWHLPSDEEWKILEGEVDSVYGYPDPMWDQTGFRGFDAGQNLKSVSGWSSGGNGNDSFGFNGLPGGRSINGSFSSLYGIGSFWTSTVISNYVAVRRRLDYNRPTILKYHDSREFGCSVRCLMNIVPSCSPQPTQSDAGPDTLNILENSIALMANIPVYGQGLWTVFSGNGGSFADSTNPTTVFYSLPGQQYNLVWTISNNCGNSSDTVIIGFASQGIVCGSPITDARDGNTYNTVLIGSQCWMSENLAYLPSVSPSDTGSNSLPFYYVYDYQGTDVFLAKATSNFQTYGVLYNWPAAMDGDVSSDSVPSGVQGICPDGWHLPSDEEWKILEGEVDSLYGYPDPEWDDSGYRGTDVGGNLKEIGHTKWNSPNTGATNNSGFTALPSGGRYNNGAFDNLLRYAVFWSSTERSSSSTWYRVLYYDRTIVFRGSREKVNGYSVRCNKN